jgi:DNA-3-methyladenine glycosylase
VLLVREGGEGRRSGRIVEVEAYAGPEDRASHARFGPASRAAAMFGASGRAYVYGVYGMHTCLNVVVGPAGSGGAVLLRAVEPLEGVDLMRAARLAASVARRRAAAADPAAEGTRIARLVPERLAAGPANLAAAFGIELDDDGLDLLDPTAALRLEPRLSDGPRDTIVASARIGVAYAGPGWADRPWRFVVSRVAAHEHRA